ncbi:MAG: hypothetical protein IPI01_21180 [Ignavibacteriae bacterium]|nr:hypothetical protein [Ignavibacteriota bacterium]
MISKGYTKNGVIRSMKEKGYLKVTDSFRKMIGDKREYCYEMTGKMKDWYQKELTAGL